MKHIKLMVTVAEKIGDKDEIESGIIIEEREVDFFHIHKYEMNDDIFVIESSDRN